MKYGLCGSVVAGVVGATVAFSASPKPDTVHLVVDGRAQTVHTSAADVGAVLADAGFRPGAHDLVAPSVASPVSNGETIVFKRGRLLRLDVDGHRSAVWTTADTVSAALADLGYSDQDAVSVSRSRRLPVHAATDIAVRRPRLVIVNDGTRRERIRTTDATVAQLLTDLSITLHRYDQISTPLTRAIDGPRTVVTIKRVVHELRTRAQRIPFRTRSVKDGRLRQGTTRTVRRGRPGMLLHRWDVVLVDGKPSGRIDLASRIVRRPHTRLRRVGTRIPVYTDGEAQAIAWKLLADYGWQSADQFSCLQQMWDRESNWDVHATNPSSGAYGIPQALPGDQMASAGPDWEDDAATQIRWGLSYIGSRYGTPCGAWDFWQQGDWY